VGDDLSVDVEVKKCSPHLECKVKNRQVNMISKSHTLNGRKKSLFVEFG